jgi:PTS system cellobiose-specific IIB component
MKKILLICALGMSSSLIRKKMISALASDESDWVIDAKEKNEFENVMENYDVVLLSPQVRFLCEDYKKIAEPRGIKVGVIDTKDYGMANGANILALAKNL